MTKATAMVRRAPHCEMSKSRLFVTLRGLVSVLVFLLAALGVGYAPPAQAGVSSGGAINLLASQTLLHIGDTIDVTLGLFNSSQTTPPDPFQLLPATLTAGTVVAFEACLDAACTVPLPGTLTFVPVGGTGCVATASANVTSCAPDFPPGPNQNKVLITISGAGVPLPALTDVPNFVDVATIRLTATSPVGTPGGAFFLRAETGASQIIATFNGASASGGAAGSAAMNFPPPPPTPTSTPTNVPTSTPTNTNTPVLNNCPLTEDFWRHHPAAWPVTSLSLGNQTYTQAELLAILAAPPPPPHGHPPPPPPPPGGDVSVTLAVQMIAAKLDIANGTDPTPAADAISVGDHLLSGFTGKLPYHVTHGSPTGKAMHTDAKLLDEFTDGHLTAACRHKADAKADSDDV